MAASACASQPVDPDMAGGSAVYETCAACHGKTGGGGVGPALTDVRVTFPGCETHIEWIRLGSEGWKAEVGETYGANDATIEQVMPAFESLGDEALRRIAMYERVRFGGGELDAERAACGLG